MEKRMKYNYTAYFDTEEERIAAIADDILVEYPRLGELAKTAAKMETPFGQVHEDYDQFSDQENHINRLINIIIITENNPVFAAEYQKACRDLMHYYQSWTEGFTYANPEEQAAYLVCEVFKRHQEEKIIPLLTLKEASDIQSKISQRKMHRRMAESLRIQNPDLGPIADQIIEQEENSKWLRFQENDLIRLVRIIKLTENNPEYLEVYTQTLKTLREEYKKWLKYEANTAYESKDIIIEMIERLNKHLQDPSVPIALYDEILEEQKTKKQSGMSL